MADAAIRIGRFRRFFLVSFSFCLVRVRRPRRCPLTAPYDANSVPSTEMGCGASTAAPGSIGDAPVKNAAVIDTPVKKAAVIDNGLKKGIKPAAKGEKGKYSMPALFAQFDADGDGKLDI